MGQLRGRDADFERAISWLNSLVNYERKGGYTKDLSRFRALLDSLGNPQEAPALKILIVGTNGKGTAAWHLAWALGAGLYTSPHLVDLRERISVAGRVIPKAALTKELLRIKPLVGARRGFATFFEVLTASAFSYFAGEGLEAWVLEAGLGGRLDATNAVHQDITVITKISLDHTHILGNTLREIAREKAAVVKGGDVITLPQEPEVMDEIEAAVREGGARLWVVEPKVLEAGPEGTMFQLEGREFWTPVPGVHQAVNAALAVKALEILGFEEVDFSGLEVPGRLQRLRNFVLDGAHNPNSLAHSLREAKRLFGVKKVIFGVSRDKDISRMAELLRGFEVILTRANTPRAAEPMVLAKHFPEAGITSSVEEALELAREEPTLITGSFYVVGEALRALGWRPQERGESP